MALRFAESQSVSIKAFLIGVIVVILLVPLTLLRGLVSERTNLREQAYARVAQGWGGNIVTGGPMLLVPTERSVMEGNAIRVVRSDVYILPTQLDAEIDLKLEAQPRRVGIYDVPVYLAGIHLSGRFDFASVQPLLGKPGTTYAHSLLAL